MEFIAISIFYSKNQWSRLVERCLTTLLDNLSRAFDVKKFLITPSFERGEHIKLVIWTNKSAYETQRCCVKFIKVWIKSNKCFSKQKIRKSLHLWMNYNNNSVHVNTFSAKKYDKLFTIDSNILQNLSKQVVSFLISNPGFSFDDLLINVISLGIISVYAMPDKDTVYYIDKLILSLRNVAEVDDSMIIAIDNDFINSKEYFLSYYKNIKFIKEPHEKEWLDYIIGIDRIIFNANINKTEVIINILNSINLCFGLSVSQEIFALMFIHKLLLNIEVE